MHFTRNELVFKYHELDKKLREAEIENAKLKQKIRDMTHSWKTKPSDKWYVDYLQLSLSSLERECDNRQAVIEQYQEHYAKYGKFYNRLDRDYPQPQEKVTGGVIE